MTLSHTSLNLSVHNHAPDFNFHNEAGAVVGCTSPKLPGAGPRPRLRENLLRLINERIQYKILYLTFKLLYTMQPPYLYDLISLQTPRNTRSSSVVTHAP